MNPNADNFCSQLDKESLSILTTSAKLPKPSAPSISANGFSGARKTAVAKTLSRHLGVPVCLGDKKKLQEDMARAVEETVACINYQTQQELEILAPESPFHVVFDPGQGALKQIPDLYRAKSACGASVIVAVGGPPASGKSEGGEDLARLVVWLTGALTILLDEDQFLLQRDLRGEGLPGKFRWADRKQVVEQLKNGRSALKPVFDDVTGGNLLLSQDGQGNIVIHNGNRTITVSFKQGDRNFSYEEVLSLPGQDPMTLSAKRNIDDSGLLIFGSTRMRIYTQEDCLVIGLQAMQMINLDEKGNVVPVTQLTEHVICVSDTQTRVRINIPQEAVHLAPEAEFNLGVVYDPSNGLQLQKAQRLREFMSAGIHVRRDTLLPQLFAARA